MIVRERLVQVRFLVSVLFQLTSLTCSYTDLPRRVGIFPHALGRVGLAIDSGTIGRGDQVGWGHHLPL